MNILDKLRGGDLRSIGRSNEVVTEIKKKPELFETVFKGLYDNDPVIRMRSADVIEKITQKQPELLSGYKSEIISMLICAKQQEVCWHMAQIAPRLEYTSEEKLKIVDTLKGYLSHKSKIVQVSAMDALANIAEKDSTLLQEVIALIKLQIESGSPALQSRGRKLLKSLGRKHDDV